jgi:hypothetical protein
MSDDGFVSLSPADASPAGQVGCLFLLAALLLLIGGGILAVFVISPAGRGDMWVMPVVGGGFALVGALLLWAGIRGARGLKIPPADVSIEKGARLVPGTTVRVRLRQPGPMTIESLRLKARCERIYRREVKDGSTVEDQDLLWEQTVVEVLNERVPPGAVLEREGVLALPADAKPTGAAQPDGRIRWRLEVWGEAGFMRATHRAFGLEVQHGASAAAAARAPVSPAASETDRRPVIEWPEQLATPAEHRAEARAKPAEVEAVRPQATSPSSDSGNKVLDVLSGRAGCLLFGAGFLFGGIFFLWMFFDRASWHVSGNPYMALVFGAVCVCVGLVALLAGVMPAPKRDRRRPPRLP